MTQVAAVTSAALDPNKVLPMLMKLGVSLVEAASMMTYLMRMKELSEGKKKKNSHNNGCVIILYSKAYCKSYCTTGTVTKMLIPQICFVFGNSILVKMN